MARPTKDTAHSHPEEFDPETYNVAKVVHPESGVTHTFTYPKAAGRRVRYEFPDSTLGELENPDAPAEPDPDSDDVVWDGAAGAWVARVSEGGSSAESAGA